MRAISLFGLLVTLMIAIRGGDRAVETTPSPRISTDLSAALSADKDISQVAIGRLRDRGPEVLFRLLALRDRSRLADTPTLDPVKLDAVIDAVGGARYSSVSGLYWYTDWAKATAAARRLGNPILSLRMLGRLTDEFSCANSRFFRTTLYANRQIADHLRDNYVLHWKSVRPVPRVTVDFGDGRRLERTVTGNSIHYVVSPRGEVIDGLPGLYGPAQFLAWLKEVHTVAVTVAESDGERRGVASFLKEWHAQKARSATQRWQADMLKVGENQRSAALSRDRKQTARRGERGPAPPAAAAAALARPKSFTERPLIQNITFMPTNVASTADDLWEEDRRAASQRREARRRECAVDSSRKPKHGRAEPLARPFDRL